MAIVQDAEQFFERVTSDLTSEFFKCRGSDSNRHGSFPPQDFKSSAILSEVPYSLLFQSLSYFLMWAGVCLRAAMRGVLGMALGIVRVLVSW
jgi:hypothetical protein